jgi:hypothetical protein
VDNRGELTELLAERIHDSCVELNAAPKKDYDCFSKRSKRMYQRAAWAALKEIEEMRRINRTIKELNRG